MSNSVIAQFDITTTDLEGAQTFYGKVFGWQFKPLGASDQVVEMLADGTPIGHLRVSGGKISPFNGVVYIKVEDIEAACERVREAGGTIDPGFPFDLPGGRGAIAKLTDP